MPDGSVMSSIWTAVVAICGDRRVGAAADSNVAMPRGPPSLRARSSSVMLPVGVRSSVTDCANAYPGSSADAAKSRICWVPPASGYDSGLSTAACPGSPACRTKPAATHADTSRAASTIAVRSPVPDRPFPRPAPGRASGRLPATPHVQISRCGTPVSMNPHGREGAGAAA